MQISECTLTLKKKKSMNSTNRSFTFVPTSLRELLQHILGILEDFHLQSQLLHGEREY